MERLLSVVSLLSAPLCAVATSCPGFHTCPAASDFPLPYNGSYPTTYPFVHGQHFPEGFIWGLGTASYQIEGAYREDGRGASIWDTFSGANTVGMPGAVCKNMPCAVSSQMRVPGATGNVANDHYHKYAQDVAMMASMGVSVYRFSIAWPRIVPTGVFSEGVNQEGVAFYHRLLDELLAKGVTPVVTLYHWDLPQGLLDANHDEVIPTCDPKYKQGWFECRHGGDGKPVPLGVDSMIVHEFARFSEFLLREFGSKVQMWVTFNEAWTFTALGSGGGKAPGIAPYMDQAVWPYVAGHNVILAHAKVVEKFREMQRTGQLTKDHTIGMTNNQDWREPATSNPEDIAAAEVQVQGQLGWYADPVYGVDGVHDYPSSMKLTLPYLPSFTAEDKALLKAHRPDFFGLNHYGTGFVSFNEELGSSRVTENGLAMGESVWLFQAAWGFRKLLNWVSRRYGRETPVYSTEGGLSVAAKTSLEGKYDPGRTMYFYSYLSEMYKAMAEDGVNVKGYFAWSAVDNYEWEMGYSERFGVLWNDFKSGTDPDSPNENTPVYHAESGRVVGTCGVKCLTSLQPEPTGAFGQTRHAKNSALWLQWVWQANTMVDPARFLAATVGGDVCYGEGSYQSAAGSIPCALSSDVPGPAPPETYACAGSYVRCGGGNMTSVRCCDASHACVQLNAEHHLCVPQVAQATGAVIV